MNVAVFDGENPELRSVYARINRARAHIEDFDECFKAWIDSDPYAVIPETDNQGLVQRFCLYERERGIWVYMAIACGDAIHSLRTALDHLACCEAMRQGKTPNGVYFPIAPSKADYPNTAKDKIRKCSDPFKCFVEMLQPYAGGNDALYALHQLDLLDKHRSVIPLAVCISDITLHMPYGHVGPY